MIGIAKAKKPGLREAYEAAKGRTTAKVAIGAAEKGAGIPSLSAAIKEMGVGEGISGSLESVLGGGKVGKFIGGNWPFLLPILLGFYLKGQLQKHGERTNILNQADAISNLRGDISPDSSFYQAMMPAAQQENQMAQAALMQRLMGNGPQLARGEELIGNR